MITLLLGLVSLVGTALFWMSMYVVAVFLIAAVIKGVSSWLRSDELTDAGATKAVSLKREVIDNMIDDAMEATTDPNTLRQYEGLKDALAADTDSEDEISLAQNRQGDVVGATSFSAEDYSRQREDARDFVVASDRNGNILRKNKIA